MSSRLLKILSKISKDIKDLEFDSEEILKSIEYDEADLDFIGDELEMLEFSDNMDDDELDILRTLVVYILIRDSSYAREDIFTAVFGGGQKIIWN